MSSPIPKSGPRFCFICGGPFVVLHTNGPLCLSWLQQVSLVSSSGVNFCAGLTSEGEAIKTPAYFGQQEERCSGMIPILNQQLTYRPKLNSEEDITLFIRTAVGSFQVFSTSQRESSLLLLLQPSMNMASVLLLTME